MGGNTGFAGGMMNRPRLDPNTGQYGPPQGGGGLWDIYNRLQTGGGYGQAPNRPQIYY
jgi:hypothetical protein